MKEQVDNSFWGLFAFLCLIWVGCMVSLSVINCAKKPVYILPPEKEIEEVKDPSTRLVSGKTFDELKKSPTTPVVYEFFYFDFNSDELRQEHADWLAAWVSTIKGPWVCRVEGHTSEEGTEEYNLALGARRAARVGEYLRSFKGITTIEKSYGEERPQSLDPKRNRRVELVCDKRK